MKKIIVFAVMATGVLVLAGCGSAPTSPANPSTSSYGQTAPVPMPQTPAQTPAVAPAPTSGAQATSNTISIQNFAFSPATLTVKKGDTVTWINLDSVPHQIKSATFNSSQLSKGQTYSFTFTTTGSFDYSCGIHPSMLGKIIVQ